MMEKNILQIGATLQKALLAGFFTALFTIILSSQAFAQRPIELLLNPQDNPATPKSQLSYEIKPTKSIEDVLTVRNVSQTETYTFKVYAVDTLESSDGTGAYKMASAEQKLVGSWVKFNQHDLTISPGKTLLLPYQIMIPEKNTPGTFKGGLVVEITGGSELASAKNSSNQQVQVITRLIEPIIISIPGRKIANYSLDKFDYQLINGTPNFLLKVSNSGNMILQTETDLTVSGTLLPSPYQMSINHTVILQDASYEKSFQFENPPLFGSYQVDLTVKVYEYDVLKDQFAPLNTIHKTIRFGIIPYSCIFALIILIVLAILAERWRRKYMKEVSLNTFIHKVSHGETLISIAALYRVNWRTVARINKLTKPYALEPGDELILPFPKSTKPTNNRRTGGN